MTAENLDALEWYRSPWVWMLMVIPTSAVAFGIVMISVATLFPDDLVSDDYYKDGMAINEQLDKELLAQNMGLQALLAIRRDELVLTVAATDSAVALSLRHVVDGNRDFSVLLVPEGEHRYSSDDTRLLGTLSQSGVWYMELNGVDEDWLIRGRVTAPLQGTIEL